ncbi:acyltransferase ChoActase/COT/CPT [Dipodascopsis uninucleata]
MFYRQLLSNSRTCGPKIITMSRGYRMSSSAAASTARTAAVSKPAAHNYVEDKSKGMMLRFQESLPRLPVPTLEETAARYLKSIHPLVDTEQFKKTEDIVKKFISAQGEGPELQKKLLARAAEPNMKNWMYEWWNDAAYLTYRDPVVPYVSYFYAHKDDRYRKAPAARAASIATAALEFKKQVDSNMLEPEYMRKIPMCMDSYKWMFNASRIPAEGKDYPKKYSNSQFLIIMRKNRFYVLPHEIDGVQLSTSELEEQIQKIIEDADRKGHGPAVGALTSENRDKWTKFRSDVISSNANNKDLLEQIQASSFIIALDDSRPVTFTERAHQFWHGDGCNRFYDKPLQFIVCDNGVSGFMGEHSMMDGTPTCRLNDFVCDAIAKKKVDLSNRSSGAAVENIKVNELQFVINDQVKKDIDTSKSDFDSVIALHELDVQSYQRYGKNLIKQFKSSPDAFVQMIIQLAYYKMFGVSRPTYESASTRQYQLGRTETCRSVSDDSVAFVKTFMDKSADSSSKIAAARRAMDSHVKYITAASAGHGVDRHLFGLKNLVDKDSQLPELFKDPSYSYSCSWYLSTSQLSSEYFNGYGWSQVIDDGFGIAYMINNNSLNFNVVSKKLGSSKLAYYLREAADDMADVFSTELDIKAKL